MTSPIAPLCLAFAERSVRYVLVGVSGANFYIPPSWPSFPTHRDALEQLLKKPELD